MVGGLQWEFLCGAHVDKSAPQLSRGESQSDVVGHIPPGKTVFVLKLRDERGMAGRVRRSWVLVELVLMGWSLAENRVVISQVIETGARMEVQLIGRRLSN